MSNRYAPGRRAWGECARSGARALLKHLVFDGRYPNLRVLPDWYEGRHPQEILPKVDDPIALYRPSPQNLPQPTTPVLAGELVAGPAASLTWSASTSTVALIASYLLYRAVNDGDPELLATIEVERDEFAAITSENAYEDDTVQAGNTYHYHLVARAVTGGDSAPSSIITITVT